jgi:hypothetical protein
MEVTSLRITNRNLKICPRNVSVKSYSDWRIIGTCYQQLRLAVSLRNSVPSTDFGNGNLKGKYKRENE